MESLSFLVATLFLIKVQAGIPVTNRDLEKENIAQNQIALPQGELGQLERSLEEAAKGATVEESQHLVARAGWKDRIPWGKKRRSSRSAPPKPGSLAEVKDQLPALTRQWSSASDSSSSSGSSAGSTASASSLGSRASGRSLTRSDHSYGRGNRRLTSPARPSKKGKQSAPPAPMHPTVLRSKSNASGKSQR